MQVTLYEDLSTVHVKSSSSPKINLMSSGHEGLCGPGIEGLCTLIINDLPEAGCNLRIKERVHDKA
jgi:hypothetical protein